MYKSKFPIVNFIKHKDKKNATKHFFQIFFESLYYN